MTILHVELYGTLIGTLEGTGNRFDFVPAASGVERFGTNSLALSIGIPLSMVNKRKQSKKRANWFSELLPEGDYRNYLASQAGISSLDSLGLLGHFGEDVAGAIRIFDPQTRTPHQPPRREEVSVESIRRYLSDPLEFPLGNIQGAGKTSLAGVQPKILLSRHDKAWFAALHGEPSTHILKPSLAGPKESFIFDEEYGLRLARALGLASYSSWIESFDGLDALVIERFDRQAGDRIHQEDMSQALGASGIEKYQEYGGVVSLGRIAKALAATTSGSDVVALGKLTVFAVAIGNLDVHSKNIGILHPQDEIPSLAPAYDCVPMGHRKDVDGRFALSLAGEYRRAAISRKHLEDEMASWEVKNPSTVVDEVLAQLLAACEQEKPLAPAHPDMHQTIVDSVEALQRGLPIGTPQG